MAEKSAGELQLPAYSQTWHGLDDDGLDMNTCGRFYGHTRIYSLDGHYAEQAENHNGRGGNSNQTTWEPRTGTGLRR